jgi:NADPH:quinone reductase-like Zn-dependent oxidoreductase
MEQVRSLGAAHVIDYTREDFTAGRTGSYEAVFDAVGKSSFRKCKPLLKPKGVYISSELGPWAENPFLALTTPLLGGRKVVFPVPVDIPRSIRWIRELLERRVFVPLMDREYPLERIAEAFEYVASGRKIGNVIIKPMASSSN